MDIAEKVYNLVKKIPKGKVTSYKKIGKKLNIHPRLVGRILSKNLNLIKIPCHRVIYSNGKVSGYVLGTKEKIKLLRREGVLIKNNKIKNQRNLIPFE